MEVEDTGAPADASEAAQNNESFATSWLAVDDETAMELSKLLESFGTQPPVRVRFIDNPYSSAVICQSSSAYVTINGNEESCGSSFSDSDSSVMASIDVGGAWGLKPGEAREWKGASAVPTWSWRGC
ncbi:hypothetical protein Pfo_003793 [Paulownia fortunei]|nr:hypothetical protein Pfo_003793 [Paulownia fortunei]